VVVDDPAGRRGVLARIRTGAIAVSWGAVIPGREPKMFEVFARIMAFGEELRQAGRIQQLLMFAPLTGPTRDTLLLLGEIETLAQLLVDEEFDSYIQEGMLVVQDLHVAFWAGGAPEALADGLSEHLKKLQEHGLV
jgi:hypothetical protein